MKWLAVALPVCFLALATPAWAQKAANQTPPAQVKITGTLSPGELTPTPEMWFYEQERLQRENAKNAVREKAEFRSGQRERRIASRQWYGLSNSRPVAASDPFHGDYSPHWTSGNAMYPNRWNGATPAVVIRPTTKTTY